MADRMLRAPHGLRVMLRQLNLPRGCDSCGKPVAEELHAVTCICACGNSTVLCAACMESVLDSIPGDGRPS